MKPPEKPQSDADIFRRALSIGGVGVVAAAVLVAAGGGAGATAVLARLATPEAPHVTAAPVERERRTLEPLTDALRAKGFHECNPHDPIGLGPYAPYRNLNMGRIAIPQKGGHTANMGFDVVIHFHGYSAVRKTLVQVANGVAYVGIDKGLGSGPYSNAFQRPDVFPELLRSVESALKHHTHDDGAHIRHVALSAWSAGYGAINEILKHGDDRVDAVILLDGLHAAWNPAAPKRDGSLKSLSSHTLTPTFEYAKKALHGKKIFIFSHSDVDPEKYPSTSATAELLLHELGLVRTSVESDGSPFHPKSNVDQGNLHVWSYAGTNEAAHCAHIPVMARALAIVEGAWDTPALDRKVPSTPAPKLGGGEEPEIAATLDVGVIDRAVSDPFEGLDTIEQGGQKKDPLEWVPTPGPAKPVSATEGVEKALPAPNQDRPVVSDGDG
ncbi:MAG TPA: hypothetical protein PKD61_02145 [Polyangiaceae bacterium]|nr:hypothetical protein [Polyangiaceae bacterium]